MGVELKRLGDTLLVRLEGEIDLHTAQPFRQAVSDAFAREARLKNLVLLMERVTFIDSTGVGAILGRYREVHSRGGRMALVRVQLPVRRVLELAGVPRIARLCDSEGEALASL